ncbi:UTP--glucose-1-phosphate uridylyltransferase [Kribbia dieselivorans]|uniref:UTP--glucose-1-phosphate uridylyltransferase n=1 Tax=Kribbia dieselivorans TaxID=331526 RepID=UPI0008385181|nr:UTP--glucose-1-phosphate uridylyltransferase [Kribbia dieselivorans]
MNKGLGLAVSKMRAEGIDERAITVFEDFYRQLVEGVRGTIAETEIAPLTDVPRFAGQRFSDEERSAALAQVAVIKLNGGLGTSMGARGAKSALPVRDGASFLDIIARQVLDLRARFGASLPLILMNSFRTHEESLKVLSAYPDLPVDGLPLDFIQSAEPKLRADDLTPVEWPPDPSLEWCPPGHGDLYVSLLATGLLDDLVTRGIRYAFVSNADNLGATCDPDLAAWVIGEQVPFLAEVCQRSANDRKGGHFARRRGDDRIILREKAMLEPGDEDAFQDIERHRFFNTNSLWIDLAVLRAKLAELGGVLGLPMMVNHKHVDPTRPDSPEVIQIESAMGTAIGTFDGAQVLEVGRDRFRPVKTTNELLLLRSDVFEIDDHAVLHSTTGRPDPAIRLGASYTHVGAFDARFPEGVPSLRECTSLTVDGDVTFGAHVRCLGDVVVRGSGTVPAGAHLAGEVEVSS